jgi:hypothetical protein
VAGDSCFGCETCGKGVYIKVRFWKIDEKS